jgi:hypothetical protein
MQHLNIKVMDGSDEENFKMWQRAKLQKLIVCLLWMAWKEYASESLHVRWSVCFDDR